MNVDSSFLARMENSKNLLTRTTWLMWIYLNRLFCLVFFLGFSAVNWHISLVTFMFLSSVAFLIWKNYFPQGNFMKIQNSNKFPSHLKIKKFFFLCKKIGYSNKMAKNFSLTDEIPSGAIRNFSIIFQTRRASKLKCSQTREKNSFHKSPRKTETLSIEKLNFYNFFFCMHSN